MKQKIGWILVIIGVIVLFIFFHHSHYKNGNIGNTIISQSTEQKINHLLNMNSYEATIQVTIQSNKNKNVYQMDQNYQKDHTFRQELKEPASIQGMTVEYQQGKLCIQNTKFNLNKIYEDYPYVTNNQLDLQAFCKDYQTYKGTMEESKEEIKLWVETKQTPYIARKVLRMDKRTGMPKELQIQDVSQNTLVYILYNKIEIHSE